MPGVFARRVVSDGDLAVPVRIGREREPDPLGVVRLVLLEEHAGRVRGRDEVVVARIGQPGEVDLLAVGRLVVLVDPAHRDALIARVAVPERLSARWSVAVEPVEVEKAEADLDRVRADDRSGRAALAYLESARHRRYASGCASRGTRRSRPPAPGRSCSRDRRARLLSALVLGVRRADLLDRRCRRIHSQLVLGTHRPRAATRVCDPVRESEALVLLLVDEIQVGRYHRPQG